MIAEQIPARLVPDVIKNTAVKIVHRLPAADDREAVGATMNATPAQSRYLVTLPPGQAAAFADGMDFPVLVKVKDGTRRERAPPARPATPARWSARARPAAAAECRARPCTLRDMRHAQRALEDVPWIGLWAELAVLAHLTGWPMPVPRPAALAALHRAARPGGPVRALPRGGRGGRRPPGRDRRPGALAAHVGAAMRAWAGARRVALPPDEPEWLLAGAVTEDLAFGVARPSVIEAAGRCPTCWPSSSSAGGRRSTSGARPGPGRQPGRQAQRLQDRGRHAAGAGRSGLPPQRPRTHIQISAAAVRRRALE